MFVAACGLVAADDQNQKNGQNRQYLRGKVVRVDPDKNVVIIRTGEGNQAKEMEYRVNNDTKYWGTDRQTLNDGLKYKGFREGTDVWYRPGTGNNAQTMSELRFYNPSTTNPNKDK